MFTIMNYMSFVRIAVKIALLFMMVKSLSFILECDTLKKHHLAIRCLKTFYGIITNDQRHIYL